MSFPRYGSYCDSGVQWLGEVPAHWQVKKIGHLADLIAGFAFPSEGFSFNQGAGIPLVRGDNVSEGYLRWGDKGRYWPHGAAFDNRYLLAENDIVIQMDGSKVGKNWAIVSSSDLPLLLVQRVTRVRVREALPRFVFLLIANDFFVRYVDQAKTDPAIPHITMRNIADYWVPLPPPSEQAAITAFLDRETGKIDALVDEQKQLIELLKEKRQAVISHAVTKGLDPNAPIKKSGVEWLGEVPEHWAVLMIKRCLKSVDYGISDALEPDGSICVLRMGNIQNGRVVLDDLKFVNEVDPALLLEKDDLLYNRTNSLDLIGKVGRFAPVSGEPVTFASYLVRLRANQTCSPAFLAYALNTNGILGAARSRAFVAIGQCNLNPTRYGELELAVPPRSEQEAIVSFLEAELGSIKALQDNFEAAIFLLHERRAVLISAAVTGKIDVRGLVEADAVVPEVVAA